MTAYLAQITARILPGIAQISPRRREQIRAYFLSALDGNGGFRGRKGQGDLYYSAFAVRGLFLLGFLDDSFLLPRISVFLERQNTRPDLTPVDILSWTFCSALVNAVVGQEFSQERVDALLARWEHFRRADGCFASTERSEFSSTYTTFLSAIFFELLGRSERICSIPVGPILERRRPDGGFTELPPLKQSGTNPTAAAVALLHILGTPLPEHLNTVDFLCRCQQPSGGFLAHQKILVPDLLSSFSAVSALYDLGASESVNHTALQNFALKLRAPDGGYFGMSLDQHTDVEFTFYGMALEAIAFC